MPYISLLITHSLFFQLQNNLQEHLTTLWGIAILGEMNLVRIFQKRKHSLPYLLICLEKILLSAKRRLSTCGDVSADGLMRDVLLYVPLYWLINNTVLTNCLAEWSHARNTDIKLENRQS